MNKEKYNQLTSDLLEKNLVGPDFIDILKNFPIEQSYIYLKLKILKNFFIYMQNDGTVISRNI